MPFGKHRGREVAELEGSYLAWLANNVHLFGPLRHAVREELESRHLSIGELGDELEDEPEDEEEF